LSRLERAFSRGGDGREPGGEGRRFVSGVLRAVGHVRREPIDRGRPYGYNAAILEAFILTNSRSTPRRLGSSNIRTPRRLVRSWRIVGSTTYYGL